MGKHSIVCLEGLIVVSINIFTTFVYYYYYYYYYYFFFFLLVSPSLYLSNFPRLLSYYVRNI